MSQTIFITKGLHAGNKMFDPNKTTYDQQIINTSIQTLDAFCEEVIEALTYRFEKASNFQKEVETTTSQFENNNFAQFKFNFPTSTYTVTVVAPKFE